MKYLAMTDFLKETLLIHIRLFQAIPSPFLAEKRP
jgi:hypothetical protein